MMVAYLQPFRCIGSDLGTSERNNPTTLVLLYKKRSHNKRCNSAATTTTTPPLTHHHSITTSDTVTRTLPSSRLTLQTAPASSSTAYLRDGSWPYTLAPPPLAAICRCASQTDDASPGPAPTVCSSRPAPRNRRASYQPPAEKEELAFSVKISGFQRYGEEMLIEHISLHWIFRYTVRICYIYGCTLSPASGPGTRS